MKCPECSRIFYPVLTPEQFKKQFKIGDKITGWSTGKEAVIVAIDKTRFIYEDHRGKDCVATMNKNWRKV